ncbi:glycosyltransferase [Marinilabiliaceae bacterium ANBcel2]|nr:glycosyltransferase [Marinilabiliaceae bacterium ANBcel2]
MQKHSYYLAKHLAQQGVFVDVYHAIPHGKPLQNPTDAFSDEELKYLTFIPVPFPRNHYFPGHYIWESYLYSKRVYKQFAERQEVDFVYVQGFSGWQLIKRKGAKTQSHNKRLPVGINFHGVEMFQKAPSLRVKLEHLLLRPFVKSNLRKAGAIFSLGGKLTAIQKRLSPTGNMIEMPIGITHDWLNEDACLTSSGVTKFVFIGRYERRKGIEELNTVLRQLIQTGSSFEFHFIGPIPKSKQLTINQSINLPTSPPNPLIAYHGAIHNEKEIQQILRDSDILVCPSWSEGMPTVILEAMASGCAIIATDVGAVSEQVDASNGLLIQPGNRQQLKSAIEKMLTLPAKELLQMKKASIERIKEKFLWDQVAQRTIEEIKRVIGEKKRE